MHLEIDSQAPVDSAADASQDCGHLDGPCVEGRIDGLGVCVSFVLAGQPCDDGDPCTEAERCGADGACLGSGVDCDDGVSCSSERCDAASGGCVYDTSQCPCSADVDCDDGVPCTADSCQRSSWTCTNVFTPGLPCNDFDPCTAADACLESGGCAGTPKNCDDGNLCTADTCDPQSGDCVAEPLDGLACDDGDTCSIGDMCAESVFSAGRLASFAQTYPAYSGPYARHFLAAVAVDDGYVAIERRVYTGPELGGFSGIFAASLTSSGVQPEGPSFVTPIAFEDPLGARLVRVESVGDSLVVLTNQGHLGRVALNGGAESWTVNFDGAAGPIARGLTSAAGDVVLCGHKRESADASAEASLWLGWVAVADGTQTSELVPEGGAGLKCHVIESIADGFLVAGHDDVEMWVGRLDTIGGVVWQRSYAAPLAQTPVRIVAGASEIGVFAQSAHPADGSPRPWIGRLGYDGQPIDEVIPTDSVFSLADVAATPDGGYLLVGERTTEETPFRRAHVLWLDAGGALVSSADGPQSNDGYTSVRRTPTGYLLTGSSGELYYDSAGVLEVTDFDLGTPCDPTP